MAPRVEAVRTALRAACLTLRFVRKLLSCNLLVGEGKGSPWCWSLDCRRMRRRQRPLRMEEEEERWWSSEQAPLRAKFARDLRAAAMTETWNHVRRCRIYELQEADVALRKPNPSVWLRPI